MMTRRELPPAEWARLTDTFIAEGARVPDPSVAKIFVTEDDDRIVAFLVLQLVPHAEPLWIDPAYCGKANWQALLEMAEGYLSDGTYYVFAPTDRIARMSEVSGLTPLPWSIYAKEIPCRS